MGASASAGRIALADSLVELARDIAHPDRDWVILAEGNVSGLDEGSTMLVKASGTQMRHAQPDDMVEVRVDELLRIIDDPDGGETDVARIFTRTHAAAGRRPSVEALLHAVCLDLPGIRVVGHAHPTAVLSLLCSRQAFVLGSGSLFPDQIVVLGTEPLFVPYVDPGLELARTVRRLLKDREAPPRVIYLQNHGLFALGATPRDVIQIIEMSVKVARVILGAAAVGGPQFLEPADVARIDCRPDEAFRRVALSGAPHSTIEEQASR